jgi:UDP-N-acetylmuramoylalanine--D-glutamate ligase
LDFYQERIRPSNLDFQGKKILVVGMGKTGTALVSFFLGQGAEVMISDSREVSEWKEMTAQFNGIGFPLVLEGGGHSPDFFLKADMIAVSPGIPLDIPALKAVRGKGTSVVGEVEIFAAWATTPLVAVTGTNGKTTTTSLLNEMLVHSGKKTFLGGNIGQPLMDYILGGQGKEIVVAEISSFQLDSTTHFTPKVGLLLNITEDHLDRYPDFQAYIASKTSLFRNQGKNDPAVVNWDDPICRSIGQNLSGPVYFFSRVQKISPGAYLEKNQALVSWGNREESFDLSEFSLPGIHNQENALAAILGACLLGADRSAVQKTLETFRGFGHRLEYVGEVSGVRFYDDSKATNVGAVVKALEGFTEPIILIAGGRDKGGDYFPLRELIQRKVRALLLIGEAQEIMMQQLGGWTQSEYASTLEKAVFRAFDLSRPGDVVLLSPACSSFDMFRDYVHRGNAFQKAVRELGEVRT